MRSLVASPTSVAPLAVFRALFGFVMAVSTVRFALKGWIYDLYVAPSYYFTFFDWVAPLGAAGMYGIFAVMGVAAVAIMLGWHYRVAVILFFLSFTYVELIEKSNYLNHYYFVSVVSFLLIWVPAHRSCSLDVRRRPELRVHAVPAWTIQIFKLQLGLVYVYAGLAKLHPEWLLDAMPLTLWLPAHAHLPVVGWLLDEPSTAYLMSWAGALYDLTIVFFLLWHRTRAAAFIAVIAFHLTTALLFQIGMFPYIMILCSLIFFPAAFHEKLIAAGRKVWSGVTRRAEARSVRRSVKRHPDVREVSKSASRRAADAGESRYADPSRTCGAPYPQSSSVVYLLGPRWSAVVASVLILHFVLQILVPLRAFAYPGQLFWTEQGYRFSWRVMLTEKAGYTVFHVRDPATDRRWEVSNWEHLTPNQEKMMSTQPDMILQFAHHLQEVYRQRGISDVEITAEAYVTLNGRRSRLMIDPNVDLTRVDRGLQHKEWILPLTGHEEKWIGAR